MKRFLKHFSLEVKEDQTVTLPALHYQRGRLIIMLLLGFNIIVGVLWLRATSVASTHHANIRKMKVLAQETSELTQTFNQQIAALSLSYSYYGKALKAGEPKRQKALFAKYEESLGDFNEGSDAILQISKRIHALSKDIKESLSGGNP